MVTDPLIYKIISAAFRQREAGKRISRKNREKLQQEAEKLNKLLKERKRADKYQKGCKSSNKNDSPQLNVNQLIKTGKLNLALKNFSTVKLSKARKENY